MSKAASKGMSNKGGKPAPFKKQGTGAAKTVTVTPGTNKPQIDNIKFLAGATKGSPKKAPTIQVKPGSNKPQLDNMRKLGQSKGGAGDNPYRGK